MINQAKALRNGYMRNWRAMNKDRVKAINERYWEKKVKNLKCEGDKK